MVNRNETAIKKKFAVFGIGRIISAALWAFNGHSIPFFLYPLFLHVFRNFDCKDTIPFNPLISFSAAA